jgi:hypothetical protein
MNTQGKSDFSEEFQSCNLYVTICPSVRNPYSLQHCKIVIAITLQNFSWVFLLICFAKTLYIVLPIARYTYAFFGRASLS